MPEPAGQFEQIMGAGEQQATMTALQQMAFKGHRKTGINWRLLTVIPAIICGASRAADSSVARVPPAELAKWEDGLRRAGASQAELRYFEGSVYDDASPGGGGYFVGELRKAPPDYLSKYLVEVRLEARREPSPRLLYPGVAAAVSCESLRKTSIRDVVIDAVEIDPFDGSCRITAIVTHPPATDRVKVWLALPMQGWNGRFQGTGGGGYAGGSLSSLRDQVAKGYAVGATDTGNPEGTAKFALDATGKSAWQRMRVNAYIGIHDMTVVGKALTQAFYGKAARYSYFVGGSTGGRQALTEAQRYPEDYDGILALYPAIARDRYVPAQLWPQVVMLEANNFLSKEKREAATAAAVKACDGADGVVDGVIDDPTRCHYDPAALVGSKVGDSIFTETDARIIRDIWNGPRSHDGSSLWWGLTPGTDLSVLADTDGTPLNGKPSGEGLDWFRYFLALDPNWDWKTLNRGDFELLFEQSIQEHASVYGGDNPDLTGLRDRGGKLLIVHGLADQIVPPQESIAYYRNVQKRMGGPQLTAGFARLFLVPGGDHGFESPVPTPRRMIDAVIRWVEHGKAPERLDAELLGDHGEPVRTRPLFPYPMVAKYKGSGSIDQAANFVSALPPAKEK
jgi:pimeloyl-ACP methyl ester carboxylesterase